MIHRSPILPSLLALFLLVWQPGPAQEPESDRPTDPLELGLEEQVDIQLVLVDFLVLDRKERTVPGLTQDDFYLLVDGKEEEIASLDVDCPAGAAEDPRPADETERLPPVVTAEPRRMVLIFDYLHMSNATEALDGVLDSLDTWSSGNEEHMIISLGQVIRIESPFTTELDEVRWAIQRMRNDPDLYAGNYGRLTEFRFFRRLHAVYDLLELWPGRKTIVLFSGPFASDGFFHDPQYRELSALSTTARASIYPVDTGGLRVPTDPLASRLGGPTDLRRLANETGGRMTADTNDIGLAYAKAHRDVSCTYTLGFHDERPQRDHERRLTIRLHDRDGRRIVYPEFYMIRSPEKKRRSLFRSAAMVPQVFESDELSAELFVMGPRSARRWEAVLAVEIRPRADTVRVEEEAWWLRGLVRKPNGTIVHSFRRRVRMPASDPEGGGHPVVTLFEELRISPGSYAVSAVLSDPDAETPRTATRAAVVAEIPRGDVFMIGPILGRRVAAETELESGPGDDDRPDFEPLVVQAAEQGDPLDSLTVVCVVDSEVPIDLRSLARSIRSLDGSKSLGFGPVSARLAGEDRVECHRQIDPLVTSGLDPGRYELTATAETTDSVAGTGSVEFEVAPPGAD